MLLLQWVRQQQAAGAGGRHGTAESERPSLRQRRDGVLRPPGNKWQSMSLDATRANTLVYLGNTWVPAQIWSQEPAYFANWQSCEGSLTDSIVGADAKHRVKCATPHTEAVSTLPLWDQGKQTESGGTKRAGKLRTAPGSIHSFLHFFHLLSLQQWFPI